MHEPSNVAADLALRLAGAGDDELDAVVTDALRILAEAAEADRTYVTLLHDDATFENSHEWMATDGVPHSFVIQQIPNHEYAYSVGFAERDEIWNVPDVEQLPADAEAERRSFSSFGVRAVLQIPIVVSGDVIGLVGFNQHTTRSSWPTELVDFGRAVGRAIGVALMRRRASDSIRRAHEEAERANAARDELLEHVSHELRTPLHAILGYAELLELDDRSDADRESLLQIQLNGRRLLTMVEDLLAVSHRDASEPPGPVRLAPVITDAVSVLGDATTGRGVDIVLGNGVAGAVIQTEIARLRQIVYYALSGAVQMIEGGGRVQFDAGPEQHQPEIRLRIQSNEEPNDSVTTMPMATALIDGHGTITETRDDGDVVVSIRFDQPANP